VIALKAVARGLGGLVLAVALSVAAPLAAQAASYPPATTGTFSVTAHPGANHVTVNGLGPKSKATAIISGSGPAPTLGAFRAGTAGSGSVRAATANLALGTTDADGAITFTLVFPEHASGVYNASVLTADGHSVSGAITIPDGANGPLAWTGSNIAMWVVWLAGILVIVGVIALIIAAARRRSRN
jgi:hypothetical protein